MSPTLTLKEAAFLLNKKGTRAVKRFCLFNNIPIFLQPGSRHPYIMRLQFEYVLYSSLIAHLKSKYNEHWFEIFHDYMSMNYKRSSEQATNISKIYIAPTVKHRHIGSYENMFLNKLKNITQ